MNVLVTSVLGISRGAAMISFIQLNRSQHMEHVVERNTESPSLDFFSGKNKSPILSYQE